MEREDNNQLAMLDTLIHRKEDSSTKITIYRKPTHTVPYLLMDSHHPLQPKLGVIRTHMHRAETLVTEEEDKVVEIEKIRKALGVCRYKRSHFAVANTRYPPNRQSTTTSNTNRGSVVIPYVGGGSQKAFVVSSAHGESLYTSNQGTLYVHFLCHPKTKSASLRSATLCTTSNAGTAEPHI